MTRKQKVMGIIGFIVAVMAVALFFLVVPYPKGMNFVSLAVMVVAILLGFMSLTVVDSLAKKTHPTFLKVGFYTIVFSYIIVTLATSLIFVPKTVVAARVFVLMQVEIIGSAAILLLIIYYFAGYINEKSNEVLSAIATMKNLKERIHALVEDEANEPYKQRLEEVYNVALECDSSTYVLIDVDIAKKLFQLESLLRRKTRHKEEKVNTNIQELLILFEKRADKVKSEKTVEAE